MIRYMIPIYNELRYRVDGDENNFEMPKYLVLQRPGSDVIF